MGRGLWIQSYLSPLLSALGAQAAYRAIGHWSSPAGSGLVPENPAEARCALNPSRGRTLTGSGVVTIGDPSLGIPAEKFLNPTMTSNLGGSI